jgi:hypothetical protein
VNPFLGTRYGLAAVTTTLEIAPDRPLAHGLGRAWGARPASAPGTSRAAARR